MNNYKNFKILIYLSILFCAGCTKNFKEYNTNPNNATQEMLDKDNLAVGGFFAQMEQNVIPAGSNGTNEVNQYQLAQNLLGDVYSGYMGASNNWFASRNNTTYAFITGWYGEPFNRSFLGVLPAWQLIKLKKPSADVFALAQIIKVEALHRTTDIYGPLPYFQFGSGSITTRYNPQDSIYYSFFNDLDSSIAVLDNYLQINPGAKPLADFDLIYGGDYAQWIKFANSLKLRLAMRIVYANPDKARQYAESAINNSYGVLTTNGDNAFLKTSNGIVINNPLQTICYSYNDIRMGASMESFLKGYNDPRIATWFIKATNTNINPDYHGIRNGIVIDNKADYTPYSQLNVTNATPVQWMTAAEVYFLRAEGALRGWNMGGTAQSLYETGIQTSFTQTGTGGYAGYINDDASKPAPYVDFVNSSNNVGAGSDLSTITIKWNAADNFETNLERIITQKWIAMYPDGQEAWTEFRRTHYPKIFPVEDNFSNGTVSTSVQVRRIPFPQSEYQSNASGVATGVTLLGGDDNGGTKLWWDKKP